MYKGLIVAHIMIRDGAKEVALRYLAEQPRYFSVSHISQGKLVPSASIVQFVFDTDGVEQF